MQISSGPTLGSLKANIHSVRAATSARSVKEDSDRVLDGVDRFSAEYDWNNETPLSTVRADLRDRSSDWIKAGGRLLALGLATGAVAEAARVASGAGFLTSTPVATSGWMGLGLGVTSIVLAWAFQPLAPAARAADKAVLDASIQDWNRR